MSVQRCYYSCVMTSGVHIDVTMFDERFNFIDMFSLKTFSRSNLVNHRGRFNSALMFRPILLVQGVSKDACFFHGRETI